MTSEQFQESFQAMNMAFEERQIQLIETLVNTISRLNNANERITIPDFYGQVNEKKARQYLKKLNCSFEAQGITDDATKVRMFGYQLYDSALDWYEITTSQPDLSYAQLEESFKRRFIPAASQLTTSLDYRFLKQNKSVSEYAARFQSLLVRLPPNYRTEAGAIEDFIHGLKANIQQFVLYRSPRTLDEAVREAVAVEAIQTKTKGEFGKSNFKKGQNNSYGGGYTPKIENVIDDPDAMDLDEVHTKQLPSQKGQCFTCGKVGHKAANCPQKSKKGTRQH